jgi:hypothetical protein
MQRLGGFSRRLSISSFSCVSTRTTQEEEAMKYMFLITNGMTPADPEAWATLTEEEQRRSLPTARR